MGAANESLNLGAPASPPACRPEAGAAGVTPRIGRASSLASASGVPGPYTKHDLETVKLDIENVRAELKRDMKELELRLTIKLGAMLALAVGAVATLVKLL